MVTAWLRTQVIPLPLIVYPHAIGLYCANNYYSYVRVLYFYVHIELDYEKGTKATAEW